MTDELFATPAPTFSLPPVVGYGLGIVFDVLTGAISEAGVQDGTNPVYFRAGNIQVNQVDLVEGGSVLAAYIIGKPFTRFFWTLLGGKKMGDVSDRFFDRNTKPMLDGLGTGFGIRKAVSIFTGSQSFFPVPAPTSSSTTTTSSTPIIV